MFAVLAAALSALIALSSPAQPETSEPAPINSHVTDAAIAIGWNWDGHKCVSVTPCAGFVYEPSSGGVNLADCGINFWGNCSGKCKYCTGTAGVAGNMCQEKEHEICIIGTSLQTCGTINHFKCAAAATPPAGQAKTENGCYCTTPIGGSPDPCQTGACL